MLGNFLRISRHPPFGDPPSPTPVPGPHQGATTFGRLMLLICAALSITFQTWIHGYRQGNTGSGIGKSVMKFQVVSEKTWKPIGFGLSVVRRPVHTIEAAIRYVGYLFPQWDTKRQTIADKTMGTVCVPL